MDSDFNDCYVLTESKIRQINIYGSLLAEWDNDGIQQLSRSGKRLLGRKGSALMSLTEEGWKSAESRPIAGPRSTGSWPHVGRASTQGLLQVNRGTAQRRLKVGRLPNIFPPIGHNYSCHIYSRIYMYMQEGRLMIMSPFTIIIATCVVCAWWSATCVVCAH